MKNLQKIFLTLLILTFFAIVPIAQAQKQAVFPSANKLQPMPTYVHPNVAGNTNSQLTPLYESGTDNINNQPSSQDESGNSNQTTLTGQNTPADSSSGLLWPTIYIVIGLIFIIWIFIMFKRA